MAVRTAILRKKVQGVLTDLMVKTYTSMVVDAATTKSLDVILTEMQGVATTHGEKLEKLMGNGDGSIAKSISTAVETAINALKNADDPQSFESRIAALETFKAGMADTLAALKTEVNTYTDNRIGDIGETTVKAYIDTVKTNLQQSIAGAFHFKGTVDYVDQLPTEGMAQGDVYQVKYNGTSAEAGTFEANKEYAYDGTSWVEMGSVIDLSAYSTTAQVDEKIATAKQAAIDAAAADATSKANKAKDDAIAAAGEALNAYKTSNDAALAALDANKGVTYASETEPENMTENDLWIQLLPVAEG